MNSNIENLFLKWFESYIDLDLQSSIHSTELYKHYVEYAQTHETLPLRKKLFIKYCREKLEKLFSQGKIEEYHCNGIKFRGLFIKELKKETATNK